MYLGYGIVLIFTLAIIPILYTQTAALPALVIGLTVWMLGANAVEIVGTRILRRNGVLERVVDRAGHPLLLTSSAYAFDRSLWITGVVIASISLTLALAWLGVLASGWNGIYGAYRLESGQHVVLGETGIRVDVQDGWTGGGCSQLRIPAELGLWTVPWHQSTVIIANPAQDNGRVSIYYGADSDDWSALRRSSKLRHLTPDRALKSTGVRSIALDRARGGSGAPAEAVLFVDHPKGRYAISVHLPVQPGDADLSDIAVALGNAGIVLPTK